MIIATDTVMVDGGPIAMERTWARWLDGHRGDMMRAWNDIGAGRRPEGIA